MKPKSDEEDSEEDQRYTIKLFDPSRQYFNAEAKTIKNKADMLKEISKLNADNVICKVARSFPHSSTRLIGIYNLAVKVIRLDFAIGSKTADPIILNTPDLLSAYKILKTTFVSGRV